MSEKDALLLRQQVLYFPEKSLKNPEYTKLSERLYQYELIQVQKREKLEELSKLLAEDNSQLSQVEKSHKKKVVVATAVAVGSRLAGATLGAFVGNYLEGLFADSPAPEAAPAVIETPKPEPFVVQGDYLERMMNNAKLDL